MARERERRTDGEPDESMEADPAICFEQSCDWFGRHYCVAQGHRRTMIDRSAMAIEDHSLELLLPQ